MRDDTRDRLYNDWLMWDNEWHKELCNVYGTHSAGDKRYNPKYNAATPELARLRQKVSDAKDAYYAYIRGRS